MKWWVYNPGTSDDPRYAGEDWEEYEVNLILTDDELIVIHEDKAKAEYAHRQLTSSNETMRRIEEEYARHWA